MVREDTGDLQDTVESNNGPQKRREPEINKGSDHTSDTQGKMLSE